MPFGLRIIPVVVSSLATMVASTAFAAETLEVEKLPYSQARAELMERGFRPYTMPGAPECERGDNKCYPELESCVQKRHWICNYTWHVGKTIYHLETRAQKQEPPVVDSFYCLLNCGKDSDTNALAQANAIQKP
ncbi:hypothetical protein P7D22_17330 [Lichenihabitans sp. Uapishka_5]|uniref:hypothetical protein n=1 Tax=Lichenihabitans sp. Uapishka_5 TaxID=3037302 RepID=UPI0029E82585|nr:hypothetical protein [Lichenihabitans sp. Uapishka_5]MDX7952930.1 hypothetical protein [Lichenihabitans sp. Uapishka_5]